MILPVTIVALISALIWSLQFHSVPGTIASLIVALLNEAGAAASGAPRTTSTIEPQRESPMLTDTGLPTEHQSQLREVVREGDE